MKWKKVCSDVRHALKCENNAIFKQIYTKKLFIAFKMAYFCWFSLRGNLDFPEFLQKKFYNINYRRQDCFFNPERKCRKTGHNFFCLYPYMVQGWFVCASVHLCVCLSVCLWASAWPPTWTYTRNASSLWSLVLPGHAIPFQKALDKPKKHVRADFWFGMIFPRYHSEITLEWIKMTL